MKKTILSIAAISVAFVGLAFTAPEKENVITNEVLSESAVVEYSCYTKFKTDVTFSECNKESNPVEPELQSEILDTY